MMSMEEQREMDGLKAVIAGLQLRIQRKDEEIERLRETLSWYADEVNHSRSHYDDMCMSDVDEDGGSRARQALGGSTK